MSQFLRVHMVLLFLLCSISTFGQEERVEALWNEAEELIGKDTARTLDLLLEAQEMSKGNEELYFQSTKKIIDFYKFTGEFRKSIPYGQELVDFALHAKDPMNQSKAERALGNIYLNIGENIRARVQFEKALNFARLSKDPDEIGACLNNRGITLFRDGKLSPALQDFIAAESYFLKTGHERYLVNTYKNIGEIYFDLGEYSKAKIQYFKTLELTKVLGISQVEAWTYYALAKTEWKQGHIDQAHQYCRKGMAVAEEASSLWAVADGNSTMGKIFSTSNPTKAKYYLNIAVRQFSEMDRAIGVATTLFFLAEIEMDQSEYSAAIEHLSMANKVARENNTTYVLRDILEALSNCYQHTGNSRRAYDVYEEYQAIRDQLNKSQHDSKSIELLTLYENEKTEEEIHRQNVNLRKAEAELESKNNKILISLLCIAGTIILFVGFLFYFRRMNRIKKEIAEVALRMTLAENKKLNESLGELKEQLKVYHIFASKKNNVLVKFKKHLSVAVKENAKKRKEVLTELINEIDTNLYDAQDAKRIYDHIGSVYQSFLNALMEEFPDLTASEREMICLFKAKLGVKDIAILKNQKPSYIRVQKSRISKKLERKTGASLDKVLTSL